MRQWLQKIITKTGSFFLKKYDSIFSKSTTASSLADYLYGSSLQLITFIMIIILFLIFIFFLVIHKDQVHYQWEFFQKSRKKIHLQSEEVVWVQSLLQWEKSCQKKTGIPWKAIQLRYGKINYVQQETDLKTVNSYLLALLSIYIHPNHFTIDTVCSTLESQKYTTQKKNSALKLWVKDRLYNTLHHLNPQQDGISSQWQYLNETWVAINDQQEISDYYLSIIILKVWLETIQNKVSWSKEQVLIKNWLTKISTSIEQKRKEEEQQQELNSLQLLFDDKAIPFILRDTSTPSGNILSSNKNWITKPILYETIQGDIIHILKTTYGNLESVHNQFLCDIFFQQSQSNWKNFLNAYYDYTQKYHFRGFPESGWNQDNIWQEYGCQELAFIKRKEPLRPYHSFLIALHWYPIYGSRYNHWYSQCYQSEYQWCQKSFHNIQTKDIYDSIWMTSFKTIHHIQKEVTKAFPLWKKTWQQAKVKINTTIGVSNQPSFKKTLTSLPWKMPFIENPKYLPYTELEQIQLFPSNKKITKQYSLNSHMSIHSSKNLIEIQGKKVSGENIFLIMVFPPFNQIIRPQKIVVHLKVAQIKNINSIQIQFLNGLNTVTTRDLWRNHLSDNCDLDQVILLEESSEINQVRMIIQTQSEELALCQIKECSLICSSKKDVSESHQSMLPKEHHEIPSEDLQHTDKEKQAQSVA